MKHSTVLSVFGILALAGCTMGPRQPAMNELPEYGLQQKNPDLLEADREFVEIAKKEEGSFEKMTNYGWGFIQRGDNRTAIKRFNQAWLIDSTRYESYWGFAAAESRLGNLESAKHYYEKALGHGGDTKILNPEYAIVLREIAKAEKNSEKLTAADDLFKSEIEAGNEKAACIFAFQLFRDGKKDQVCEVMKSCPTDRDHLKERAGCNE